MCRLADAIESVGAAADCLTQTCIRQAALADLTNNDNPTVVAFRRKFRTPLLTPSDMLKTVEKIK